MWKIEIYEKENGDVPLKKFIQTLDKKMRSKFFQELDILKEYGNNIREPYSKYIGNGIFELRVKHSSNIIRVFYFFYRDKIIVLTNGFIKKTQKTPDKEIELAEKYKRDYEGRLQKWNMKI